MAKVENNAKNITNAYGDATHFYGNGTNATRGSANNVFFLERKGIEQATTKKIFSQFASEYSMPQNTGKEFRVTVSYNSYDRLPFTDDTWNDKDKKEFSDAFFKYGFMSERDVADVSGELYGITGQNGTITNTTDNGFRLVEGQLSGNKISLKSSTFTARLERFGVMMDFTLESLIFDDTYGLKHYYENVGDKAGQLNEDAIQLDMLSTPNVMYAGTATSKKTLGVGIGKGEKDATTRRNAVEESYKINYSLIQKITSRLINFRAPKHTKILSGSTNVDTKTINASYVAIVGNQVRADLENVTRGATVWGETYAFTRVEQYSSQTNLLDGEVGSINNIRFCATEQMMKFAGAGAEVEADYVGNLSRTLNTTDNKTYFDVFPVILPCEDSFATIGLQGRNKIEWKSKNPSETDTLDTYGSYGYVSASFFYAGIIKRPERLMVVYVLASE